MMQLLGLSVGPVPLRSTAVPVHGKWLVAYRIWGSGCHEDRAGERFRPSDAAA